MEQSIPAVIGQLEQYIHAANRSGNKYDFIDPACTLCQQLEELNDPSAAIEPLFRLIEHCPDIDYGGPGPLGAFLESFYGNTYEEQLLASLHRKPAIYTLHLLDRLVRDDNNPHQARYLDTMRMIAADVTLPELIRQEAMDNLQHAAENMHGWTDELKSSLAEASALLEEAAAGEAKLLEKLKENEPRPPVETVSYGSVTFRVITRREAAAFMPLITDIPGLEGPYNVWDEWRFPLWILNGYFLLAEDDAVLDTLELDYSLPGVPDVSILGFIFQKNLQVRSHIIAFDTDSSPALIVHGNMSAPCIHLSGNIHYAGGQVQTNVLWTKYNHGELYINGSLEAKAVFADDMAVYIRQLQPGAKLISYMGMNIHVKVPGGEEWLPQTATHDLNEVFLPGLCTIDGNGDTVLREEGPDNVLDRIKQHKPLLP